MHTLAQKMTHRSWCCISLTMMSASGSLNGLSPRRRCWSRSPCIWLNACSPTFIEVSNWDDKSIDSSSAVINTGIGKVCHMFNWTNKQTVVDRPLKLTRILVRFVDHDQDILSIGRCTRGKHEEHWQLGWILILIVNKQKCGLLGIVYSRVLMLTHFFGHRNELFRSDLSKEKRKVGGCV